jgi:hypothetical protein
MLICADYSSIANLSNAATIESTINAAIVQIESHFYNSITVDIAFQNSSTGLGSNNAQFYVTTYQSFINALEQESNEPYVAAALAHLPTGAANPVNGNTSMAIKAADAAALGIPIQGVTPGGTVTLNLNAMNLARTGNANGKYDLETVAMHEIDEVLGLGSSIGQIFYSATGPVSPEDLFRYDATGARTFAPGVAAWFETTPGTQIVQFNSTSGLDYGDWANGSGVVRAQDATGTTGTAAQIGLSSAEIQALAVIGYETAPATPEPSTWMLFLTGAAVCGIVRARYT